MNPAGSGVSRWRKSSYSSDTANCVEVALALSPTEVGVRDSKDPGGPALVCPAGAWRSFVASVRAGDFDRPLCGDDE